MRFAAQSAGYPLQRIWLSRWACKPTYLPLRRLYSSSCQPASADKPHYTTTPIFYVNAEPHIGHLHSSVLADVFSRWAQWRNQGWSVAPDEGQAVGRTRAVLATGTDEHGIKIQKVAEASKEQPRDLCDRVSERFKALDAKAGVEYSRFIRTTDKDHVEAVKELWQQLEQRSFIYKGTHEGWYSESDEAFYTEAQIKPSESDASQMVSVETGSAVEWSSEENYKFKLSAFQQPLLQWLRSCPDAVVPASRMDTLIAEIGQGLADLSVSRPRSRLHWGIPVPSDEHHTIYVWLDALTNYLTVAGYPWQSPNQSTGCWPADVQVIGKDIIRFHAIYFPAFLMALDLPLPKHIVSHGHWTMNKQKMSKSRGNVANPFDAIEAFGRDDVRWFLCRIGGNLSGDADWSESTLLEYRRKYLQGQWGNLVSRIMAPKVLSALFGTTSSPSITLSKPVFEEEDMELVKELEQLAAKVDSHMAKFEVNKALESISEILARCNVHLQSLEPWKSGQKPDIVRRSVYLCLETCRISALLVRPVMPDKMQKLLETIQDSGGQDWTDAVHLRAAWTLQRTGKPKPLFPRIETPSGEVTVKE